MTETDTEHTGPSPIRVRVLGRYELFAKLGSGGMAEVHLARQRGLKRFRKLVVVKTIHPQLSRDERFIDLLLEEARVSALLKHPRVVDIYDVDEVDGVFFIAMEYLPGQSLTEIIKAGRAGEKLDVMSSVQVIVDTADGLEAAHQLRSHEGDELSLVHRDVSPGNVVVLYSGGVKIVDFGVAKAVGHLSEIGAISKFAGKLGYAAPEQLRGARADQRSDIFSLGVVLWELLCHRRLFSAKSREQAIAMTTMGTAPPPSTLRSGISLALDEACLRALAPEPNKRYQSAAEMGKALVEVLEDSGYRRERGGIATYMDNVFAERRADTEELIRRISETTNQISIAQLSAEDAATTIDELLPEKIASTESAIKAATSVEGNRPDAELGGGQPVAAVKTAPGTPAPWTGLLTPGHPWRRPLGFAVLGLVSVLLVFVLVEVATSGAGKLGAGEGATSAAPKPVTTSPEMAVSAAKTTDASTVANDAAVDPAGSLTSPTPTPTPTPPPTGADASTPGTDARPVSVPDDGLDLTGGKKAPPSDLSTTDDSRKPRDRDDANETKKDDPAKAEELTRDGMRAARQGKFKEARRKFAAALKSKPGHAAARRGLGVSLQAMGNRRAAIRQFRRYLKQRPDADDIRERLRKLEGK